MRSSIVTAAFWMLWFLVFIPAAGGEQTRVPLDPEQETFYLQFRSAAQSEDAERLRALSHSESQACVHSANAAYYDRIIAGMIRVFGHDQKKSGWLQNHRS